MIYFSYHEFPELANLPESERRREWYAFTLSHEARDVIAYRWKYLFAAVFALGGEMAAKCLSKDILFFGAFAGVAMGQYVFLLMRFHQQYRVFARRRANSTFAAVSGSSLTEHQPWFDDRASAVVTDGYDSEEAKAVRDLKAKVVHAKLSGLLGYSRPIAENSKAPTLRNIAFPCFCYMLILAFGASLWFNALPILELFLIAIGLLVIAVLFETLRKCPHCGKRAFVSYSRHFRISIGSRCVHCGMLLLFQSLRWQKIKRH